MTLPDDAIHRLALDTRARRKAERQRRPDGKLETLDQQADRCRDEFYARHQAAQEGSG